MNLSQLERYAKEKMIQHGLFDWKFEWENTRRIFGRCWNHRKVIGLSRHLCSVNSEDECFDTVLHEIAHALNWVKSGKRGHDASWRRWCVLVGARPVRCYSTAKVVNCFKYHVLNAETGAFVKGVCRRPKWWPAGQSVCTARLNGKPTKLRLIPLDTIQK